MSNDTTAVTIPAGLQISLIEYSGEADSDISFIEFRNALLKYIEITGNKSPKKIKDDKGNRIRNPRYGLVEKEILRNHLVGLALSCFDQLPSKMSFYKCIKVLGVQIRKRLIGKIEVFKMVQKADENFMSYCLRVLDASRSADLGEEMVVPICFKGASPEVKEILHSLDEQVIAALFEVLFGEMEKAVHRMAMGDGSAIAEVDQLQDARTRNPGEHTTRI